MIRVYLQEPNDFKSCKGALARPVRASVLHKTCKQSMQAVDACAAGVSVKGISTPNLPETFCVGQGKARNSATFD